MVTKNSINNIPDANRTSNAICVFGAGGTLTDGGPLTNGQLLIGNTGNPPTAGNITSAGLRLSVTNGAGTINVDTIGVLQTDTGWDTWGGAGNYFDDTTLGSFTVSRPGTGYINGVPISWAGGQTVTGMTAGNTYFIYIDSTGTIGKSATRTDALFTGNIVLFECLRDSTTPANLQITVKENHPSNYPVNTSNYEHDNIGTLIENNSNGANITLNGTQSIQINEADVLSDHGLETTIPDSGGVGVTWNKYYTDGTGKWARQNSTTTFTGFYNNAGTPTALGASKFAVYTLYVSKDNLTVTTPVYFAVLDTSQYNNQASAQTAISNGSTAKATNELKALELCQLGYIIYSEATASIVQVIISKTTLRQTLSTSGTNQASLVNTNTASFDGVLSAANTNVQSCLDTIDECLGTGGTASSVTIGNTTGASFVNIRTGTGGSTIATTNSAFAVTTGTGAINIGADAVAHTVTIGNVTGATAVNVNTGTGGSTYTTTNGTFALNTGTGAINVGTDAAAKTLTIGNITGATAVNINTGTGGSAITTTNGTLGLITGTGAINIGADAAAKTITIGNGTGATSVVVDCGTGALNLGTNAVARTTTLGNTTGASALALQCGTGDFSLASATGNIMLSQDTGETTFPLQSAFLAYLGSFDNNVTGNGAIYTLGTVTALTEVFDQNSDFNVNGTFTAPVTGRYHLNVNITYGGTTNATAGQIGLVTSNRSYYVIIRDPAGVNATPMISHLCDMDAADTATATLSCSGEAGNTDDVTGQANLFTAFSGYLEC